MFLLFLVLIEKRFKVPGSDTYIVFGEAVPEDFLRNAQMKAAEKFKVPETTAPAVPLATIEDENEGLVCSSKIKFLIKIHSLSYKVFI